MHKIGIRYEDKYVMEKRVPLVPRHVKELVEKGIGFEIETSAKRVFNDEKYAGAGVELVDKIKTADVVLGVKEMPVDFFEEGKTYIFFSHTIKGQPYNMPMLRRMMEKKVNLIDYERIVDEKGRRLIFFGRFAGLAGMINSLWSLGQRWREKGYSTPFLELQQTHHYHSLDEAKAAVLKVGEEIRNHGLTNELSPIVIGITGYGHVSKGAQEILELLPVKEISPTELLHLFNNDKGNKPDSLIYKVVFMEKHLSRPLEKGKAFDLQEYYDHPEQFESRFEQYIPSLTVLMNCMYWDDRYPRLITKDYLEKLFSRGEPKLTVIGDVTCDPDGSIECTHKGTKIEDPVFVYNPFTRKPAMGFKGEGILVMAVDILPSELPREASQKFSDALFGFMPAIANTDFNNKSFKDLDLPLPVKNGMILHKGQLTPDYQYLKEHLNKQPD